MHFCHEEVLAFLGLFPWFTVVVLKIRAWFHARKKCPHT